MNSPLSPAPKRRLARVAPSRAGRGRLRPAFEGLEVRALMAGAVPGPIGTIAPPAGPVGPVGEWTVMVYLTATDLAENGPGNIREMERAAARLPDSVRIVVLYDQWANQDANGQPKVDGEGQARWGAPGALTYATDGGRQAPWGTAGIGLIAPADPARPDQIATRFEISDVEVDTGDPETLRNFVSYAAALAPARRYALVMWDHGAGVESFNNDDFDVLPDRGLTTSEFASALSSTRDAGVRLDLIAFDECLMSTVEVAHALRDLAPVLVASEEEVAGQGQNYEAALRALESDPGRVDAAAFARSMLAAFQGQYGGKGEWADTLAAIDSPAVGGVTAALASFVAATGSAGVADWREIARARSDAAYFSDLKDSVYRDLGQFMSAVSVSRAGAGIRQAARGVLDALDAAVFAKTQDTRRTSGLSIFFPDSAEMLGATYTAQVQASGFLQATGWTSFLSRFHAAAARAPRSRQAEPSWAYNDGGPSSALDLGVQAGARQRVPAMTLDPGETAWFRLDTTQVGRAGDAVRAAALAGSRSLIVQVFAADAPGVPLARGRLAASLRGLPAGEYLVSATAPPDAAARFGLEVAAPRLPRRLPDLPGGNTSRGAAEDLGTVLGSRFVAGLSRSAPGHAAWYAFATPRSEGPVDGFVTLLTDGQPLELSLYDEAGGLLGRARGRDRIRLPYAATGSAEGFSVKVAGARGAYSLFFTDEA